MCPLLVSDVACKVLVDVSIAGVRCCLLGFS